MVAVGLAVDARCPSHVAGHHDQRRLQQAALGQILQQGRECPVEERQQEVFEQVEVVLVRVPWPGPLVSVWTVTKVTPALTSRRASSTLAPNVSRP